MKSQIDDSEAKTRGREDFRRHQSKIFEWEVLPPEDRSGSRRTSASLEPLFRWLALIMDEFLRFPGTKIRFGLDPIIGLLPGIGDVSSAIISAVALVQAARYGVPKILLARMAANILINELIGIIPGIGDAFSFWFKSCIVGYVVQEAPHTDQHTLRVVESYAHSRFRSLPASSHAIAERNRQNPAWCWGKQPEGDPFL